MVEEMQNKQSLSEVTFSHSLHCSDYCEVAVFKTAACRVQFREKCVPLVQESSARAGRGRQQTVQPLRTQASNSDLMKHKLFSSTIQTSGIHMHYVSKIIVSKRYPKFSQIASA